MGTLIVQKWNNSNLLKEENLRKKFPDPRIDPLIDLKFGTILNFAHTIGATFLATGHYARILKKSDGRFHLYKGIDQGKDQSYFLSRLKQRQLAAACFPLGAMTKSEVIKMSRVTGLSPLPTKESQDICFVKGNNYKEFFKRSANNTLNPGYIEDINGKTIGEHNGLHLFTIGQRRGIDCPASEPYYVLRLDSKRNRLIVGFKKDLFSINCRVENINWINKAPLVPMTIHTRIRYRHKAVLSTLFPVDNQTATVRFERPQLSVTPGQGAVFYKDDEVLGGGWILS